MVEAVCPTDELIEAISWTGCDQGSVLGVQWHPEFKHTLNDKILEGEKLLDHFLSHCDSK